MPSMNFSYEGMTVRVESRTSSDLEWLEEFLHPCFDSSDTAPDFHVEYLVDAEQFSELHARGVPGEQVRTFMMDTRAIHYPLWTAPGNSCLLFDEDLSLFMRMEDRRVAIIAERWDPVSRVQVMRVVRELAMGAAQAGGGRFLHASALSLDGRAIIVVGRRMAGKTSLLTYLLSHLDASLLTNDRLLVFARDDRISVRGMPTVVSIRNGTLALFPGLEENVRRNRFNARLTLEECQSPDGGVFGNPYTDRRVLSPAQFCAVTDSKLARDAVGSILLFPQQTGRPGGIELRELDVEETRTSLADGLFGQIGPDQLSEVFTLPASDTDTVPEEYFLHRLATSMPAYQCTLGQDAYNSEDGAQWIRQLLA